MSGSRQSEQGRPCMYSADVERLLHLGTPEPLIPHCTNNRFSTCKVLHKYLLTCGSFKPACAAPQSSQRVAVSSHGGNSISPSASGLLSGNIFLMD